MSDMNQRGMVLSGVALLLVLPALLLSATFLTITHAGGETTSIQTLSDKAAYKANDIKQNLRDLKASGKRISNEIFREIAENYEQNTIFDNIQIEFKPFNIWVRYSHETYGEYTHYSTENFCEISNLGQDQWYYNFEAQPNDINWDFNEPLLKLERLGNGRWKVTVLPTFTHGSATGTVYWENQVIFWNVNGCEEEDGPAENIAATDPGGDGHGEPGAGWRENESTIITGVPSAALVKVVLEDPGGTVHYEETFPLTTPKEEEEYEEPEIGLVYNEDAAAMDREDSGSIKGGVEFSITNNYSNTVTINQIEIDPINNTINGLSDEVYGTDPWDHEVYAESDVDDYVDYGGGISVPDDGLTVNINPEVNGGNTMKFYLYEFYDYYYYYWGWSGNHNMVNEDIKITLYYEVGGNSKTEIFTITPK